MDEPDGTRDHLPPWEPPRRVGLPVNLHRWSDVGFLHWPFPPEQVQPLLGDGLEVLTHDGRAWVGVTPFSMNVRLPVVARVPPPLRFPETNLRTYVVGPDGRQGVRFLHMEVTARWFVAALRAVGLPYVRRRMSISRAGHELAYRSDPFGAADHGPHQIRLRPEGGPLRPTDLERFSISRWGAFHSVGPVLLHTPVDHPPWEIFAARVDRCELDSLFSAVQLPAPSGPPIAHYSPGVNVRVGPPRIIRRGSRGEGPRPTPTGRSDTA